MKRMYVSILCVFVGTAAALCGGDTTTTTQNTTTANVTTPRVGVVNFRKCVEDSKAGKAERDAFDAMRKQMEATLDEKDKKLGELTSKLNDPDYKDSLSPEAEEAAQKEYQTLSRELTTLQHQYYGMLNQANFKIVQKLVELVGQASAKVAKTLNIDIVLNEESSFFYSTSLDISDKVIAMMDESTPPTAKTTTSAVPTTGATPSTTTSTTAPKTTAPATSTTTPTTMPVTNSNPKTLTTAPNTTQK